MTVVERMKFRKSVFMYNIKHNIYSLNKPMKDMFEISNNRFHNLRRTLLIHFHISKPKTHLIKKILLYYLCSGLEFTACETAC